MEDRPNCWKCKRSKELIKKVDILHNHKWICFHCLYNLRLENQKLRGRIKYLEMKQEKYKDIKQIVKSAEKMIESSEETKEKIRRLAFL